MDKIISKELAKKLMEAEGEIRGALFRSDATFVLQEKGKEGLKKVEEETKRLGCPIRYEEMSSMRFYPIGLEAISLLTIKKMLGFPDEKFKEMGAAFPKRSFALRLTSRLLSFMKDPKKSYQSSMEVWKEFVTAGKFEVISFDDKDGGGSAKFRIKGLNVHPLQCIYLTGAIASFQELGRGRGKKVNCQETKCTFKGDEAHEFLITW